jgi:hypothetical protein
VEGEARRQTVCLLKTRIGQLGPVLITTDFNTPAGGEIHRLMITDFKDAWITAERRLGPECAA